MPDSLRGLLSGAALFDLVARFAALIVLGVLVIIVSFVNSEFWQVDNLRNVATQNAPIAIVAIGMTFVIISGMFDLSVGALFAAGAVVYADLAGKMPLLAAAAVTLLVGLACGLLNGGVVTLLRVNPFIATIGTGAAFSGAVLIYSNSTPIQVDDSAFQNLGLEGFHGVPWAVLIAAIVFAVSAVVLGRTIYGRYVYVVGGNREAARLTGIRVKAIHVSVFAIVGVCSVAAGMILASQLSVGQPTLGASVALDAFAIVVIGGTSVQGGEGAVWRTVVGVLILGVLNNLFNSLAWDFPRQEVVKGCVLVAAVALDSFRRSHR